MALIIHIIIAVTSVVFASVVLARPSRTKLYANYSLIGATLASGTYLVLSTGAPLVSACTTGLIYLSIVLSLSALARRKLTQEIL